MFERLHEAMEDQIFRISHKIGDQLNRSPTVCPELFGHLHGHISHFAIFKAHDQYKLLKEGHQSVCSGKYYKSMGIPCYHMQRAALEGLGHLTPQDFHVQWHLDYNPELAEEVSVCIHVILVHSLLNPLGAPMIAGGSF